MFRTPMQSIRPSTVSFNVADRPLMNDQELEKYICKLYQLSQLKSPWALPFRNSWTLRGQLMSVLTKRRVLGCKLRCEIGRVSLDRSALRRNLDTTIKDDKKILATFESSFPVGNCRQTQLVLNNVHKGLFQVLRDACGGITMKDCSQIERIHVI